MSVHNGTVRRTGSGCLEQLLDRRPARLFVQERFVAGVLEQATHEVRHAGDEVADRAVGADPEAAGGQRVLKLVAQAAEYLQLEIAVLAAGQTA